jgi:hypothetical protein
MEPQFDHKNRGFLSADAPRPNLLYVMIVSRGAPGNRLSAAVMDNVAQARASAGRFGGMDCRP